MNRAIRGSVYCSAAVGTLLALAPSSALAVQASASHRQTLAGVQHGAPPAPVLVIPLAASNCVDFGVFHFCFPGGDPGKGNKGGGTATPELPSAALVTVGLIPPFVLALIRRRRRGR
jgi:hypothetical protein